MHVSFRGVAVLLATFGLASCGSNLVPENLTEQLKNTEWQLVSVEDTTDAKGTIEIGSHLIIDADAIAFGQDMAPGVIGMAPFRGAVLGMKAKPREKLGSVTYIRTGDLKELSINGDDESITLKVLEHSQGEIETLRLLSDEGVTYKFERIATPLTTPATPATP